jgi:hypothetical protein
MPDTDQTDPPTALPREAREGLMRAWLKVLSDRHPDVTWLPVDEPPTNNLAEPSVPAAPVALAESA